MAFDPFDLFRYAVLALAGVLVLAGLAARGVQRRVINPFSRTARLVRGATDWLIKPLERRMVRMGANPVNAPWWLVGIGVVGGILLITFAQWLLGEIVVVRAATRAGGRSVAYIVVATAFSVLEAAIFVRVIGSWLGAGPHARWMRPFVWLTEWLIAPLRRIIPPVGMFDFTPMAAWVILWLLRPFVLGLVAPPLTMIAR